MHSIFVLLYIIMELQYLIFLIFNFRAWLFAAALYIRYFLMHFSMGVAYIHNGCSGQPHRQFSYLKDCHLKNFFKINFRWCFFQKINKN